MESTTPQSISLGNDHRHASRHDPGKTRQRTLGTSSIPLWSFVMSVPGWPAISAGVVCLSHSQSAAGIALVILGIGVQVPFYRFLYRQFGRRSQPSA